jgi:hypothetical protein
MKGNKVVKIIKSLSPEALKLLDKWVQSPIHNRHRDVIALFQYLRKYKDDEGEKLSNQAVFWHLFPGSPFNMQQVHYVSSYLLKVTEEFLAWQEWRKNEQAFSFSLLGAYFELKLSEPFSKLAETLQKNLQSTPRQDGAFYLQQYRMQVEKYNFGRKIGADKGFDLQLLSDLQDIAYIAEKLKNACILISHAAVTKNVYKTGLLDEVLQFLEGHPYLQLPVIETYYYAFRALSDISNRNAFDHLKRCLIEHGNVFNINDLNEIHVFAINYCVRRFNSGDQDIMREAFDIYQAGLEKGLYLENGVMAPRTYSNIVMAGLRQKDFDRVERFIHDYKETLPEKVRGGFFYYNLARLYYEKKLFDKAMPLLQQMEHDDVTVYCIGKTLLAKMYYELGELDLLSSLLQSFDIYVRRKKMLGYHRDSFLNFIRFLKKVLHTFPRDRAAKDRLRSELTEYKLLVEKEWLAEQLN